jgi:acyl phosphate:glycerol-3-phosphate acyltransferase
MTIALAIIAAYVVGSIDFAVIVARIHGVDIHNVGSGNPGASNVLRTMGRFPAAMVLLGDTLKGVVGAAMGWVASGTTDPTTQWAFAAGLAAVVGHCYPLFHRFKGGRGVATGLGVLFFTVPWVGLIDLLGWGLLAKVTKVAAVASMVMVALTIPLVIWQGVSGLSLVFVIAIILLVVWRHRANLIRMIRGTEKKMSV